MLMLWSVHYHSQTINTRENRLLTKQLSTYVLTIRITKAIKRKIILIPQIIKKNINRYIFIMMGPRFVYIKPSDYSKQQYRQVTDDCC